MTNPPHPGIKFPPPLLFVAGGILAWILETYVGRFRFVGGDASTAPLETAGAFLIALGLLIGAWALITFARAKTAILPMRPVSRLVDAGPYRITRNPMYTGMSLLYLGGMLVLNWGWALLVFPVVIFLLYRLVIRKEEAYMTTVFGESYLDYCHRVRRWI